MNASEILKRTRRLAGLSQRELARRAGTAQSLVSRIERGLTDPTTGGLTRLLGAAGFAMRIDVVLEPASDTHMLDDISRVLNMTPEERLVEVANISRFEHEVTRAVPRAT